MPGPDPAWSADDSTYEWWPALPVPTVSPAGDDGDVNLPQSVPGGMDRLRARVRLLNAHPVPPGVHHDVQHPLDVVVTLRWETGDEETETVASGLPRRPRDRRAPHHFLESGGALLRMSVAREHLNAVDIDSELGSCVSHAGCARHHLERVHPSATFDVVGKHADGHRVTHMVVTGLSIGGLARAEGDVSEGIVRISAGFVDRDDHRRGNRTATLHHVRKQVVRQGNHDRCAIGVPVVLEDCERLWPGVLASKGAPRLEPCATIVVHAFHLRRFSSHSLNITSVAAAYPASTTSHPSS